MYYYDKEYIIGYGRVV